MSDVDSAYLEENKKFAFDLLEQIENTHGIPLIDIFKEDVPASEIRKKVRAILYDYAKNSLSNSSPTEDWPLAGPDFDLESIINLEDSTNIIPNVSVTEHNYKIIRQYAGTDVHDYLKRVSNGLALIKDGQSASEIAGEIIGSGLAAFAVAMIVKTIKSLKAGMSFRAALTTGVRAMGAASVVVSVAFVIITEILIYLIFYNKKNFLGLVLNNTDENLIVNNWRNGTGGDDNGDLFMNTGSMSAFMETNENEDLDSPLVQIIARSFIAENDPDNLVMGGMFFAEKNVGFYGTEGVMVLKGRERETPHFALLFACPYSFDNGANVSITTSGDSAKQLFDALYGSRGLDRSVSEVGFTFAVKVAAERGGDAAGIACLDKN